MGKKLFNNKFLKIEFHRTYYFMALGFVLTGHYLNLIIFTSLIIIHELGHYITARLNNFNVEKIIIYPYGGLTKISDMVNRDICEELLIATSGVIIQYLFYLFIFFLYKNFLIREYTYNLYNLYNNQMIFFNLLPIYPLDGGKILNLLLYKYFSFNKANILTILISIIIIFIIVLFSIISNSYSNIMVMILLLAYIYKFYINRKYLYRRFLLERYLYNIEYSKIKVINNINNMYKNKIHLINTNNIYIKEKKYLSTLFKNN